MFDDMSVVLQVLFLFKYCCGLFCILYYLMYVFITLSALDNLIFQSALLICLLGFYKVWYVFLVFEVIMLHLSSSDTFVLLVYMQIHNLLLNIIKTTSCKKISLA